MCCDYDIFDRCAQCNARSKMIRVKQISRTLVISDDVELIVAIGIEFPRLAVAARGRHDGLLDQESQKLRDGRLDRGRVPRPKAPAALLEWSSVPGPVSRLYPGNAGPK
jgi:hypothetical protein